VAVSEGFTDYVRELFAPFGEVSTRKMFGGVSVYVNGRICGILADDSLWLKADAVSIPEFEAAGSGPFTYDFGDGKTGSMNYYAAPTEMLDDPDAADRWARLALDAAARAPAPRKRSAKKGAVKRAKRAAQKATRK